jgi:HJR/Mrr/RecB family endonuclease
MSNFWQVIFLEQMNLFDLFSEDAAETKYKILDKVKIRLIEEAIDSETHHYRKHYEAHILNKIGEITNVLINGKNVATYEVDIYGSKYYLLEQELEWLG